MPLGLQQYFEISILTLAISRLAWRLCFPDDHVERVALSGRRDPSGAIPSATRADAGWRAWVVDSAGFSRA